MPNKPLFTCAEVAPPLGVTTKTLAEWINAGFIDPIRRGVRGADRHLVDPDGFFALFCGRTCRGHGLALPASGAVMRFVANAGLEHLTAEFAAGRSFLIVVGDDTTAATADVLLTRDDALGPLSPSIRKMIGPFVPVIAVDLGEGFAAFEHEVAQIVAAREERTAAART